MTMDNHTIQELAKSSEGTMLALNAIAEQLQKSNDLNERVVTKLDHEDKEEADQKEDELEKTEYSNFVKTISDVVSKQMDEKFSGLEKQIQELGGDETKKVSGKAGWPMSSRSSDSEDEKSAEEALNNPTEHGAQKTIEAMAKQDMGFDEDEAMDGSDEFPMTEDEGMEEETEQDNPGEEYSDTEVRNMSRMIKELRKDMATMKKGESTRVEKEVELRLRKAGWREEKGLAKGRLINTMGGDDVPIVKSQASGGSLVDQLEDLPWSELALLKEAKSQGFTDGIPQEIVDLA